MPIVNFSQYPYYPALRCSTGEHMGYRNLSAQDKGRILPVFELSQRGNANNFNSSVAYIQETIGARAFIFDLCHDPAPAPYDSGDEQRVAQERAIQEAYNRDLSRLLDPTDGFAAWRRMVANFPNAIPVIQFTEAAGQARQILRQASLLSRAGSIAVRITQSADESIGDTISQIISIIDSPDQLLIIIDCGQGRQLLRQRAEFARNTIERIVGGLELSQVPLVRAVCMSNTFTKPGPGLTYYRNDDWRLWRVASESFPFLYGDYAAMHRFRRTTTFTPSDYLPTVVYPLDEAWLVYRHESANDDTGWVTGSAQIMAHERYRPVPDTWGVQLIERAAGGNIDDVRWSRFWHAAKVNIHIRRQIDVAAAAVAEFGDEDGEEG